MNRKLWVVCYDVRDERRLRRLAKVMERYGQRVQKSVFECWLTRDLMRAMQKEVGQQIDRQKDSVRMYFLCKDCRDLSSSEGNTEIRPIERYYIA